MSRLWGYACISHDPHLTSECWAKETGLLVRTYRSVRAGHWPDDRGEPAPLAVAVDYETAAPIWWLRDHPHCRVELVDEYGGRQPILPADVDAGGLPDADAFIAACGPVDTGCSLSDEAQVRAQVGALLAQYRAELDRIGDQVRAECWTDCEEADPCGYCQHGYRRGRRDAARDLRAAGETTAWSRQDAEHAARIAEGEVADRG